MALKTTNKTTQTFLSQYAAFNWTCSEKICLEQGQNSLAYQKSMICPFQEAGGGHPDVIVPHAQMSKTM